MIKVNKLSKAPKAIDGPTVGAFLSRDGVTVRVVGAGERPTLPGATVRASDDTREAISAAARLVAERLTKHARQAVPIVVAL